MVDLIHRCQQGDPDAFEQLFREFYPKVLRTAFFITHSIQEAEDAAQETFLAVHKGIKGLREPECFTSWLKRVTIRQSLKQTRMSTKDSPLELVQPVVPDNRFLLVEDSILLIENIQLLMSTLNCLSDVQRSTLLLKYFWGYTENEIAMTCSCSVGTVKSRIHYAKRALSCSIKDLELTSMEPSRGAY